MGLGCSTPAGEALPDYYYPTQIQPLVDGTVGRGKTIAITGCTSGLGIELAITACKLGASKVIMLNRPSGRVTAAKARVEAAAAEAAGGGGSGSGAGGGGAAAEAPSSTPTEVVVIDCDLTSFESVREACKQVLANVGADGLDILCCNAGIMGVPKQATTDGFDIQMQVNHLSHFLMIRELMPAFEAAAEKRGEARIASHSSGARFGPALEARFFEPVTEDEELGGDVTGMGGGGWVRYHQSKLAVSANTMALAGKLKAKGSKVKALVADPGTAASDIFKDDVVSDGEKWFVDMLKQSTRDGTLPITFACFDPAGESGDFYAPSKHAIMMGGMAYAGPAHKIIEAGVPNWHNIERGSVNEANQTLMWEMSEKATGGPFLA